MMGKWLGTTRFYFAPPGEGSGAGDGGDDNNGDGDDNDTNDENEDDDQDGDDQDANLGGDDEDKDKKPAANATPQEKRDWRDRQIDRMHRRQKDLERENDTLRAIAEGRANPDGTPKTPAQQPQQQNEKPLTQADVEARAQQLASQSEYDRDCNVVFAKGKDAFEDWEEQLARLPKLGGIDQATMINILATDNPEQVIHTLASNPEEYERVMELPMAKRANALTKLGLKKPKETKKPSDAPAPPDSVRGRRPPAGKVDLYDDSVKDEDWYAERERRRAERKRA